ncbi:mechanosensitive ion channel family protein [Phaeobacter marinintestinus]|uniref:mechanosensitive ion channel family protein n=1 Tax=Falsiphaeobacter marinintestinus TaxID=1492905 RepID=UPI0011B5C014|nr:mechanosensitive ion channel family protein [Phaeobacter marinintestinus]
MKRLLSLWMLTLVLLLPAGQISAQLAQLTGSKSKDTSTLSDAIQQAADAGVGVIVIDANGQVITTSPTKPAPAAGDDHKDGASPLMEAQSRMHEFNETLDERLASLPDSITEVSYILRATSPDGRIMTYAWVLFINLVLLAVSRYITFRLFSMRFARQIVEPRILEDPQGYSGKMPFLIFRFMLGVAATLICIVLTALLGLIFFGQVEDISVRFTVTAILVAFFVIRVISDLWRMILSPFLSQYRIPKFTDREALRLYRWAWILATFDISALVFSTWIADFGLNYNVYALLYGVLSLIGAVGTALLILFNAGPISRAIRNGKDADQVGWLTRFVSFAWAPLGLIYVVFSWLELSFDLVTENDISLPLVAGSYGILLPIVVVYGVINFVIERYFDRAREVNRLKSEHDAQEVADGLMPVTVRRHDLSTFEDLARRVAGILAFVAGSRVLIFLWMPDIDLSDDTLLSRMMDVSIVLFLGYIVYHAFRIWIDTKIDDELVDGQPAEMGDEGGEVTVSRLATLLPLFRGAILSVVVVSISLIILMELGINVSPLFAGAGVVGLAVGFGAQTLVRDIFSGAFFLIDDAFRKGEYIDIGDVKGTVEKISVRSFQLRHHLGALNTIPFGEIKVLTNYSRDWVIMKLPLRVTYDTDVEKVRKLIKKLGQQLLEDPVIGENFIQPLKSQGVIEMQDSAMIIRVKFMTKPGDQWLVRKKVYQDIRELFAKEGIKFAHREVTVRLADGAETENLTQSQRNAITGAVEAAIDEDYLDDIGPGGDDR